MKKEQKAVNISQSLIKRLWEYEAGEECGMAIREIDILKNYKREPSAAMKLGQYFEYLCTGQVLRDGSIPEEPLTSTGKPTADSKRASIQAENFNAILKDKGMEIIDTSVVLQYEDLKAVLDAVVKTPQHEEAILDIKYTGLLGDKWHEMGWTEGGYKFKHKLTIQPLFYKYVYWKIYGIKDIPFMYAIHSSKNEFDYDIWEVGTTMFDNIIEEIEDNILTARTLIEKSEALIPLPTRKRCARCPVFPDCPFREVVPITKSISLSHIREA